MRIIKLVTLGLAIFGGVTLVQRVRARLSQGGGGEERATGYDDVSEADRVVVAVESGLAEVDPELLAQMGEGIDLDANERAHSELGALHERMPGRTPR